MNVLFVQWEVIPKRDHLGILGEIPIGGYVGSLPFNTGRNLSWKIPIPVSAKKKNYSHLMDMECIEFRKHRVYQQNNEYPHNIVKEMYAWEKTH